MRAGPMRERLELFKPVVLTDGFGSEELTYEPMKMVHAERISFSGRRSEEVAEHFSDYTARFNIRDAHEVEEHWRVRPCGGYMYEVLAIEPNRHKGFLTLICGRINE